MSSIATFPSAIDADLIASIDASGKVSVQVIGMVIDDGATGDDRLSFVIVDHEGHGRVVSAATLRFTDDAVTPPKFG
jgi:hypothetical protein